MKQLLKLGLLSDTHVSNSENGHENRKRFERALAVFAENPPDAVMICGDLCDWDCLDDITVTREVLDNTPFMRKAELLVTPGNHDAWCAVTENHPEHEGMKVFEDYNIYEEFLTPYVYRDTARTEPHERLKGYYHTVLNGVNIISTVGYDGHHGSEAISFLKSKLDLIREGGNVLPVIVITHVLPTNTVESTHSEANRWHSGTLRKLLNSYPEVVLFAGHTHYPIDRDAFWQDEFTVINNGTLDCYARHICPCCGMLCIAENGEMTYKRYMLRETGTEKLEDIVFFARKKGGGEGK